MAFNKYQIIKKAISYELANFVFNYFLLKRDAVKWMYENNVHAQSSILGTWSDKQVPNTFSCYADFVMETLIMKVLPIMQQKTGLELLPTYSYARIYKNGDILKRHTDRYSCEVSVTLHIGGDKKWPIFYDTEGKKNQKGKPITLNSGDLLIYSGNNEHWREPYKGQDYCQVFLHYHDARKKDKAENIYDGRAFPGLPSDNWFKPKHNDWFKKWKK